MMLYDTVVIGAGPAGSYAAQKMAAQGMRVLLVEEHATIGVPRHCTGVLGREAYDRFPDLPREPIQGSLSEALIISPSGERARAPWFSGQAYVVDRSLFDQALAEKAVSAGVELRTSCTVTQVQRQPEFMDVEIKNKTSRASERVQAKAVVLATGISSRLHAMLGLEPPDTFLQCAQTEGFSSTMKEVEVYVGKSVAPGSFAWAVPIGNGKVRVGVTAHRDAGKYLEKLLTGPILRDRLTFDCQKIVRRPVPIRPVKKSVADRALLIGDAAGQVKPTTGGGIYYGLIGADLAAQTLGKACQSNAFDAASLMPYDREWRRVLKQELFLASVARRCFEWFTDDRLNRLVKACQRPDVSEMIRRSASFDWHARMVLSFLGSPRIIWQLF
jgi:digeranylgeranylglycerophospholipid reductase